MAELNIYKGRGSAEMRDDYLDFINYVFGFNGDQQDFLKLLPKLYLEKYNPCENNYVAVVDGKLKSAIGIYPREMKVLDETLKLRGVGNVAVHPYARSKGYMRELLNIAVKDMIDDGIDLSDLGGLRHRYGYFSYELAGPVCRFNLDSTCMRHSFGDAPLREISFKEVNDNTSPMFDEIFKLYEKSACRIVRTREDFIDVSHSWNSRLFAICDGDKVIGYYIGHLNELTLADIGDFDDVIRNFIAKKGGVNLTLPLYKADMIAAAEKLCGGFDMGNDQNYTIFNWKKVISAFLKLKASYQKLVDGEVKYLVHGIAKDEAFSINIKNNTVTVIEIASGEAEIVLEHRDAVAYFFGLVSAKRMLSAAANSWFPLPLFIDSADHV